MSEKLWKVKMLGPDGLWTSPTKVLAPNRSRAKEIAKDRHPNCTPVSASVVLPFPSLMEGERG